MKKIISFATVTVMLQLSCTKTPGCDPGMMHENIFVRYLDSHANYLFADGSNGYIKDSVRVYDFENGDTLSRLNAGFYPAYDSNKLLILFDGDTVNGYNNELIYLKPGVVDTLRAHIAQHRPMYTHFDSVWYNGQLKPGADSGITVIK